MRSIKNIVIGILAAAFTMAPLTSFASILPEDVAGKVLPVAKVVSSNMKEKLNCAGLNLVQNNGEVAGQTVRHFHMHVKSKSGFGS